MEPEIYEVPTPHGPARVHLHRPAAQPAARVDTPWAAVADHLIGGGTEFAGLPLVTGGRSFGARGWRAGRRRRRAASASYAGVPDAPAGQA